jgi:hypothetical protein
VDSQKNKQSSISNQDVEEITTAMLDAIVYEMILDNKIKDKLTPHLKSIEQSQKPVQIAKQNTQSSDPFSDCEIISNYLDCLFTAVYSQP